MRAFAGDPQRVEVIARARSFKASWIELAEALSIVFDNSSWERWGFDSFDVYCKSELHLTPATASKLLGSFRFLKTSAPKVIERVKQPERPTMVPSLRSVNFVSRAAERGAADASTMREIQKAAFEDGEEAPVLTKRFGSVAFPISAKEKKERLVRQLTGAGRRLANLIADPDSPLPHKIASNLEEAIGGLLEALDN